MPDPLLAAVERLRASVDALPEDLRGRWEMVNHYGGVGVPIRDGRSSYFAACVADFDEEDDPVIGRHIALTADPRKVLLLADLLAAIARLDKHTAAGRLHDTSATIVRIAEVVVIARDALASHLTEGSTTP